MNYPITIGIVGGGQLGKMLTLAAKKMGFFVIVTDPTPGSPAGQVADKQIVGGYKDENATRELAKLADIITIEAEFVNDQVLQKIANSGKPVHPSPKTIGIIKDKLEQKEFLKKNKIPTAEFAQIPSYSSSGAKAKSRSSRQARTITYQAIEQASEKFGYPMYLKAREDAYDGKGNYFLKTQKDIKEGLEKLKDRTLYIEKYVPFAKEVAVMVARSTKGEVKVYPVVQTIHRDSICDTVIAPAKISKVAKTRAQELAIKTIKLLKGAGVFGFEMFLTKDDKVLINEIAPRVHNSGHYTIEASVTSQFEQHIRAITGLPLGSTEMLVKSAVMKNILGTREGIGYPQGLERALRIPGISYHLYNKKEGRVARKMGHLTVVGDSVEICLTKANKARKALVI
ncbi:MAG: 5-(carboxyamino)imidazole ribonucleotide synthase [Candidatus Levybacteria bacterium]|nr:5-(carboxyamino)imidazole ribonucleotide synthase [Candidatus Levybacteria bacterium]